VRVRRGTFPLAASRATLLRVTNGLKTPSALADLASRGLVRPAAGEPEPVYAFRHALIQEAAYASLTRQERRRLHREIGLVLEGRPRAAGADASLLARHFGEAGEVEKAVPYAIEAASHAVDVLAFDEALSLLEKVEGLTRDAERSDLRRSVLERRGDVYARMRLGTRAITVYREALDLGARPADPTADLHLNVKILRAAAAVRWAVDRAAYRAAFEATRASRRSLEQALPRLGAAPLVDRVHTFAALSLDAWRNIEPPDWPAAARYAERAAALAEESGDPVLNSIALEALGDAELGRGDLPAYRVSALRRLALLEHPAFVDRLQRADALRGAGAALMYLGRYEEALDLLRQAEASAEAIQAVDQQFNALSLACQCAFRLDRWDDVLALEARWTELERHAPSERTGPLCFPMALAAVVHELRGEVEMATRLRRRSYAIMLGMGAVESWRSNAHY